MKDAADAAEQDDAAEGPNRVQTRRYLQMLEEDRSEFGRCSAR